MVKIARLICAIKSLSLIQFIYLISEQSATAILPCSEGENTTHNSAYKAKDNKHKNQTQTKNQELPPISDKPRGGMS